MASENRPRTVLGLGEEQQVVAGTAPRVQAARLKQRADHGERPDQLGRGASADRRRAGVRPVEAGDEPHHG
jgi:hypothetical protein